MPSLRAASGVVSLLLSCPAAAPLGECQTAGCDVVATLSETLLLQVSQSRRLIRALSVENERGLQQRNDSRHDKEVESPTATSPKQNSSCSSACTYKDVLHVCRARVVWSLDVGGAQNLTDALDRVNTECSGQCQCSADDFPYTLHGQPAADDGECHSAVEGEQCHKAVEWARTHGIRLYPSQYQGLTYGSTFQEFQQFLHKSRLDRCWRPCELCHTAEPGEPCFATVTEAMTRDDLQLTTFEEVQNLLNRTDANASCPVPCNLCHTAQPGETCFKGVRWAMQHGIHIHPDRYPGLAAESTFEAFQTALHQANHERCPLPCSSASPSMPSTETSTMPTDSENDTSVNESSPHMEIDSDHSPHMEIDSDHSPHMEIDSDHSPNATSEEPTEPPTESSDMISTETSSMPDGTDEDASMTSAMPSTETSTMPTESENDTSVNESSPPM